MVKTTEFVPFKVSSVRCVKHRRDRIKCELYPKLDRDDEIKSIEKRLEIMKVGKVTTLVDMPNQQTVIVNDFAVDPGSIRDLYYLGDGVSIAGKPMHCAIIKTPSRDTLQCGLTKLDIQLNYWNT